MSTRPLSYVGVLDDFALRYADGAIGDVAELNRQLVLATLFSDPLLINDGYLLSHAAIRDALVQPESSPLKHLVECGYVKILSRNDGDLGGLAHWMADAGISSAKLLLGDERFRESYLPVLKAWSGQLQLPAYDAFRDWPNIRLDEIYKRVSIDAFERLFESSVDVQEELRAFRTRLDDSRQRRTEWEDIGAGLFDAGQISHPTFISLMKAANESYQYAWGCSLAKEIGSVRVVTRIPQHLANFELSEITVSDTPKRPIKMAIPDAAFALKSVEGKWEKLAGVVTTGNDLNVLKHRFLDSLRAYYQASDADDRNVKRCGEQYTVALSMHFGGTVGVNVVFDLAFVGASTAAGGVFAGPLGMAAGAALSVAGVVASHLGAPKLLWRLSAPSPRKWLVNRDVMARPELVSAFQIDRGVAENYTRGIPRFKP